MTLAHAARRTLAVAPLLFAALAGCDNQTPPDVDPDIALRSFTNCGELEGYVEEAILETLLQSWYGWGRYAVDDDVAAPESGADGGGDAPSDYSTTNNQEAGVDELDIVKTNGTHIFTVQNHKLYIVKSWPIADASLLAGVEIAGWPTGLFLEGDTVVVASQVYNYGGDYYGEEEEDIGFTSRSWSSTRLTFVDVSDPEQPEITRTVDVEGYLADGRLSEGQAYFVINTWMPIPQAFWDLLWSEDLDLPEWNWEDSEEEIERKRERAREILAPEVRRLAASMDLSSFLPLYRDTNAGEEPAEPTTLHACTDVYRPSETSQYSVLNIVQLDLEDGDLHATGLLSDGWQVYASQDNLYVSQSSWWWWWGWGEIDLETRIHQFALSDRGPRYAGSGAVPGWTLDQFSYSEYDGHLRVATTDMDWWWGAGDVEGANNLFVLENQGGALNTVGEVRGIAPGERIMTARMMGERGYMVTFRQTDPLFTLDLSDPTEPTVVGELHMPGYSSYLHPMGEDHLLAVGMDGEEDGTINGLAVNVFDVSDFANPQLTHQWLLDSDDWSWSESLWDHHAFTYHRGILSFPAYTWDWDGNDWHGFSGIIVLDASADGITELGRIDHADLVRESDCIYDWDCDQYGYEDYWYAWMRRTVYVEDNLFSISNYGMKVNDLYEPEIEHTSIVFEPRD